MTGTWFIRQGMVLVETRMNIKVLNAFLLVAFATITSIVITMDVVQILANPSPPPFRFLFLSSVPPEKILTVIIAASAAITYIYVAVRYNAIRLQKKDQYLSSLVFFAAIYQAASRISEIVYLLSESSLDGMVYVAFKFYLPLDILTMVLFSLVAFEVFLKPSISHGSVRWEYFMSTLGVSGVVIGILILFFHYVPDDSPVKIAIALPGIALFSVIVIVVLLTCVRIVKLWSRTRATVALLFIGMQLLLAIVGVLFFILTETLSIFGVSSSVIYMFRISKNAVFLAMAILYMFGFIKPSQGNKPPPVAAREA